MKTYTNLVGILLMVALAGCSKSASEPLEIESPVNIEADYSILLEESGVLKTKDLKESDSGLEIGTGESAIPSFPTSELTYFSDNSLSFFQLTEDCTGKILIYDFESDSHQLIDAFLDLDACNLQITSVSHSDSRVFISFTKNEVGKEDAFYVRVIDIDTGDVNAVDIELELKPLQTVPSAGKLFVLTIDDEITDENALSVIDIAQESIVFEKMIGFDAKKIFRNPAGDIIISYPELHTTLDSSTMAEAYTQYGELTKPNLFSSEYHRFDGQGKMYYTLITEEGLGVATIPAVYNFDSNISTQYFYENFLSDAQLSVELNIHSTTAIAFDDENNFILVGYKKNGNENAGGLLRITPTPDFTYVDNLNLPGVPKAIYVN